MPTRPCVYRFDTPRPEDGEVLDVGRVTSGRVSLILQNPGRVKVVSSEARAWIDAGDVPNALDPSAGTVREHDASQPGRFTEPEIRGGFRYLKVTGPITAVEIEPTSWPSGDRMGSFACSDEELTRIWEAAADTIALTTVPSHLGGPSAAVVAGAGDWMLVDGAKRDRLIWAGDLGVQVPAWLLAFGDPRPALDSLAYLASHQREDGALPGCSPVDFGRATAFLFGEYSLWWVIALAEYVRRTADRAGAAPLLNTARRALDYAAGQCDGSGLWVQTPSNGFQWKWTIPVQGRPSYTNSLHVLALRAAAELFQNPALAQKADALSARIQTLLWDADAGALVDSDEDLLRHPQDGNALAVLGGVIKDGDARRALALLRERCWLPWGSANVDIAWESTLMDLPVHNRRVYAFMNGFEVEARFLAGDTAGALELLRRCWGHMLRTDPASTFWEWAGPDGNVETPWASCAHGWSNHCLTLLTERVLGVRPIREGYSRLVVDPAPTGLDWAEGRVPTPSGIVEVRWEKGPKGLECTVRLPKGVGAEFSPAFVAVSCNDQW